MLTNQEMEEGIKCAEALIKLMEEHVIIDERNVGKQFTGWATPERVVDLLHELKVWRTLNDFIKS